MLASITPIQWITGVVFAVYLVERVCRVVEKRYAGTGAAIVASTIEGALVKGEAILDPIAERTLHIHIHNGQVTVDPPAMPTPPTGGAS